MLKRKFTDKQVKRIRDVSKVANKKVEQNDRMIHRELERAEDRLDWLTNRKNATRAQVTELRALEKYAAELQRSKIFSC